MNFSKGILESRKQTYKHLKTLLKPIPLETPTRIELSPGNEIQVTLFDANHCVGAVMFLIEGQGKAILYTGDIRSEDWWVNNLTRHPTILPYLSTAKRLDTIYLDTTFAVKDDPHRDFPSKADGLKELLQKLEVYPPSTSFYFQAWTFGYEDVWLVLSQALRSPVHLDPYRHSIFTSVARTNGPGLECRETPVLCGFKCGNTTQQGILTRDAAVRLHSCERGTGCDIGDGVSDEQVVSITPIISRHAGVDIRELGAGGGHGDLDQIHELDLSDPVAVAHLFALCQKTITDEALLRRITDLLTTSLRAEKGRMQLGLLEHLEHDAVQLLDQDAIPLDQLPKLIADLAMKPDSKRTINRTGSNGIKATLPKSITFPYSRHSSYNELRLLVGAFRPRNVWPCTAPPAAYWTENYSMSSLFGDLCDSNGADFAYDVEMRDVEMRDAVKEIRPNKRKRVYETQRSEHSDADDETEVVQDHDAGSETESDEGFESAVMHAGNIGSATGMNPLVDGMDPEAITAKTTNATPQPAMLESSVIPDTSQPQPHHTPADAPPNSCSPPSRSSRPPLTRRSSHTSSCEDDMIDNKPKQHAENPPQEPSPGPLQQSTDENPANSNHHMEQSNVQKELALPVQPIRTDLPSLSSSQNHNSIHESRPERHERLYNQAAAKAIEDKPLNNLEKDLTYTLHRHGVTRPACHRTDNITANYPTATKRSATGPSPTERLRAREDAHDKALRGRWHEVGLQSVKGSGGMRSDEEL